MPAKKKNTFSTDEILLILCKSVTKVLSGATGKTVTYSPVVQRITKTSLKPDIGCFVLFDGVFSGIVIMNFTGESAMEIYNTYMLNMGMPESELATLHSSDEVGNTLGELTNQIVGEFTAAIEHELLISVNQSQPKMLAINREVALSINANLDNPQGRKVAFKTAGNNTFFIEMAMDKTTFVMLEEFDPGDRANADDIIANQKNREQQAEESQSGSSSDADDLLDSLGI
jgi:chemotaxis protein CheY-P-specific phosphatase CheC